MARKRPEAENEWEEVQAEQASGAWEWIEWEKGEEVIGYWLGSMIAGRGQKAWRIGLLAKEDYEEYSGDDDSDAQIYAFSLPVKLGWKLEKVEEDADKGFGSLVKIKCLGKVKTKSGTRAWDFAVLVNKKKKLDEDTLNELRGGRKIVPLIENISGKDTSDDEDEEFEE